MFVAGQAIRVRALPALLIVAVAMLSRPALLPAANASVLPERPRVILDTTYVPPTGRTLAVPAGGDLQAALNAAVGGDVITLQAGATFSGPFTLPNKSGTGWIIVRTSAADSTLPPPGTRITGAYAGPALPKIVVGAGVGGALRTTSGAHHFRFIGIEFAPTPGAFVYSLIELGAGETSAAALPHDLIFDRCFIHGDPTVGGRRGIAMNSAATAVIDSALWGFTEVGADAQAIASWSGTGPFKIVNNYLEASGENVMFGGDGPSILNLVPADIEVRGNYFFKPLTWKVGDPSYAGVAWTVKNLFELKNAQRVLLDGNIFEHNWVGADQHGAAVLFTVRNQTGSSPWAIVADVTFTHNIVRHATGGIEILGRDYLFLSQQAQRLLIQNNLFDDIGGAQWAGADRTGRLFQLSNGAADVIIDHNTAFQTENPLVASETTATIQPDTGFSFTNTITPNGPAGVTGPGTWGNAILTLNLYAPGAVFVRNAPAGGAAATYPSDNFFPASLDLVGFLNLAGGDYHLAPSSPYKNTATDGRDLGADIDALTAATASALSGVSSATPSLAVTPQITTDFGSVSVGASADRSFTVTNTGGAALTGTVASATPFSIVSGGAFTLSPGTSQTVVARFSPPAAGSFANTVLFNSNASTAARSVTGSGAAAADTTPPVISSVTVSSLTSTTATITWTTNEPADAQAEYGLTTAYGTLSAPDSNLVTAHVRALTGLSAGTLYHYRVRSQDASGNLAVSADSTLTTIAVDTTAPTISIASPAASAVVSGTITVSATASDNVGVVGVQYKLDGANLSAEQTIAPYAISWDTTAATNAAHTLTAVARDAAGNAATSAPVTITVSNLPSVSVSPTSIAFDSVTVGTTSAAHNVQVTNTGSVGASLSSVTSIGPFAISQNYCVANGSWNGVMAPGTHCDLYVVFAPVAADSATGTLSISGAGSVYPVTLAGTGVAPVTSVSVSLASLAFGSVTIGTTSAGQNVQVTNTGSVGVSVSSVTSTGPFAISQNYCVANGSWNGVMAPGTHCDVFVAFAPVVGGNATGTLSISAAAVVYPITLAGMGVAPADTTPPTVSIASPGNGATVSGTVPVSASAADNVSVVGVQFKLDGTNLGLEETSSTYSIAWDTTTVSNGSHALTAVARDAAGNTATSAAVTVTVNNDVTPPVLSTVTASSVGPNAATITWTTDEPADSQVEYGLTTGYGSAIPVVSGLVTAHTVTLNSLAAGTLYHYRAKSKDAAGNLAVSPDAVLTTAPAPDTTPPAVSISTPAANSSVSGTITVIATATDNVGVMGVQFKLDNSNIGSELTAFPYAFTWDTTGVLNGSHTLTAVARDAAGNTSTSLPVSVTVSNPDTLPPSLPTGLTATADSASQITLAWSPAADNVGVTGYQVFRNGVQIGIASGSSYQDTGLSPVTVYTYTVAAFDAAGNTSGKSFPAAATTLAVQDTTPPTVSITAPTAGTALAGTVTVAAGATDDVGVVGVQFKLDGASLGSENTTAPYRLAWDTTGVPNGAHTLTAAARDAAGNTASAAVTVTVSNDLTPPVLSGATASALSVDTAAISWTTDELADSQVEYGLSTGYGSASVLDASRVTAHTVTLNGLTAGTLYHYRVKSKDAAGNLAVSPDAVFTTAPPPDTTLPAVSITTPAANSSVSGTITVSATAADNVGVASVQFKLDDVNLGPEDTVAPYSLSWNTATVGNGLYALTAVARDAAGNTASAAVTVTVSNDLTPPVLSGATASALSVDTAAISWTTDELADSQVEYGLSTGYGSASVLDASRVTAHTVTLNGLTAGTLYHYRVKSKDAAGNLAVSPDAVFTTAPPPDTTLPAVSITTPAANSSVSGTITVSATATDNVSVVGVQFKLDNANLGAETTIPLYTFTWNTTTVANGTHTLTAVARDAAGNVAISAPVSVMAANGDVLPPSMPTGLTATAVSSSQIFLVWSPSTDNVGVVGYKIFRDGMQVATSSTSAYQDTGLSPVTTYKYTVAAFDAVGNTSAPSAPASATTLFKSAQGVVPASAGVTPSVTIAGAGPSTASRRSVSAASPFLPAGTRRCVTAA